ncbi:MAG TPA: hypothetical protein PKD18_00950 [Saprospiraceae bacterium]|nr:hypothetical protein [Saprospiraceae bacterium]
MRKLIFLFAAFLFSIQFICSQSFDLTCEPINNDCLSPMPNTLVGIGYRLKYLNLPIGANTLSGTITISQAGTNSGFSFQSSVSSKDGDIPLIYFIWNNTSDPTFSISGTIKDGSNTNIGNFSLSKVINVKFLGNSGNFDISGGTLVNSTAAEIDCGIKNFNVSIGAPTTSDPINAPITYSWTYTGGYTGPATTTSPTATVTSPSAGNGSVSVVAKRNDVTTYSNPSKTLQINRKIFPFTNINISAISSNHGYGNNALCIGETGTLQGSLSGFTGATFSWSSSTLSFIGASNLANVSYSGSNAIHQITLTANNGCSSASRTTDIKIGKPIITQKLVNSMDRSGYVNVSFNPVDVRVISPAAPTSSTFAFDCPGACGSSSLTYLGNICTAYLYPFGRIRADMTNRCGTSDPTYFYITNTSYSGFRISSPNPTSGPVVLEILDYDLMKDKIQGITLDSDSQRNIRSMLKSGNASLYKGGKVILDWDISDLPNGTYYITMTTDGRKETQQIIKL